jgi:Domain of unknown function (DUF892)
MVLIACANQEANMPVRTVQDLFVEELRDIYHAERQITKALPKMARAASNPELKQAFELHLEQTRGQIDRLDQVFEQLDLPKRGKKCEAMEGLLEEARSTMERRRDRSVRRPVAAAGDRDVRCLRSGSAEPHQRGRVVLLHRDDCVGQVAGRDTARPGEALAACWQPCGTACR